jgi:hypothetical protein
MRKLAIFLLLALIQFTVSYTIFTDFRIDPQNPFTSQVFNYGQTPNGL